MQNFESTWSESASSEFDETECAKLGIHNMRMQ